MAQSWWSRDVEWIEPERANYDLLHQRFFAVFYLLVIVFYLSTVTKHVSQNLLLWLEEVPERWLGRCFFLPHPNTPPFHLTKTRANCSRKVREIESRSWERWLGWWGWRGWRGWRMIICNRPDPPDDHLQEAGSSVWSFARGRIL